MMQLPNAFVGTHIETHTHTHIQIFLFPDKGINVSFIQQTEMGGRGRCLRHECFENGKVFNNKNKNN